MEMMRGSDVAAPTDIENQLETLLKMELHNLSPMSPSRCIYRVPDRFRRVREMDYTPRVISIGPFHHGNEALKPMEVHKKWYLKCFMERTQSNLNDYIGKIRDREEALRNCYSETIVLSSDQFVRMILVDAIFLIEFLLRGTRYVLPDEYDCIFEKPRLVLDVETDLLMLENQLPLFILEDLFCLDNPASRGEAKRLSIQFVINHDTLCLEEKPYDDYSSQVEGRHFVDLLRDLSVRNPLLKNKPKGEVREPKFSTPPSIEKLHLAGVKIKGESIPNLFDISFDENWIKMNGVLKIPKLRIDDSTELILRNLIAFEQCSISSEDRIISHYVILMDMLVNSPKDVELLVDHNIIENDFSSDNYELSSMINRLSRGGIGFDPKEFYYTALCNNLQKFCSSKWPKWMANLKSKYFNTPWATISVVAAVVLLIFTAVQTICSIDQLSFKS